MPKLMECVPNFSLGQDKEKLEQILNQIRSVPGVRLLDYSMDASQNRSVTTFVGEPEAVSEAAFLAIQEAAKLIDMTVHKGEHPRMGATDVCPFVPISDMTMDECAEYAKSLGKRVGEELNIYAQSFDAVYVGEALVYVNSLDYLAVAINQGNFSKAYGVGTGAG